MDKGASAAYDRIEQKVAKSIAVARDVLLNIEKDEDSSKDSSSSSDCSEKQMPKTIIRKPEDSGPKPGYCTRPVKSPKKEKEYSAKLKPDRNLYFPIAKIGNKNDAFIRNQSMDPLESLSSLEHTGPVSVRPDSAFPTAVYSQKVAAAAANQQCNTPSTRSLMKVESKQYRKSKTGTLFPVSTYTPKANAPNSIASVQGSRTDVVSESSMSLSRLPMTFYSTDGTMKMLLTKPDREAGVAGVLMSASDVEDKDSNEEFPIVPKQLSSKHKIEPIRNKFRTKFCIGENILDISGLFKGEILSGNSLEKIVINGKSYV